MIKVFCYYQKRQILKIEVSGHANFAEYNKDIVCAGVSAILIGGLNALDTLVSKELDLNQEENKIVISVNQYSKENQLILQTILLQLQTIASEYKKNIVIKEVQ